MYKNLSLSLLSVILFSLPWLGFPGYALLFAFVPLLIIQERLYGKSPVKRKRETMFLYSVLTFALWSAFTVYWIKNATLFGAVAAVFANTLVAMIPFMVYHYVWQRAHRALAYTVLVTGWIAYEFIYINGQFSFPWLVLGNGFSNTTHAVQWYEYTGSLGGSLWVLIVNILLFETIKKYKTSKKYLVASLFFVFVPIITSLIIYNHQTEGNKIVNIEVIQPNIDPYNEKFDLMSQNDQTAIILDLAQNAPQNVDYIITPETSIDDRIWENDINLNGSILLLRNFMKTHYPSSELIIGATTYRRYDTEAEASTTARTYETIDFWYDFYNTAIQIDSTSDIGIYHKSQLVAGVEMIPYYNALKFLEKLSLDLGGMSGRAGTDPERSVFVSHGNSVKSGVAICYESIYGDYFTDYIKKGAEVMFVITNDGWWGDTPGHRQHFSFSRLRAIETRRSIARSANTGISGFINSRGDVISKTTWDERVSINSNLSLSDKITFYVVYGDYIGRLSAFVAVLCLLYFVAYRFRKKDHIV